MREHEQLVARLRVWLEPNGWTMLPIGLAALLREAIAALSRVEGAQGWRPIASAPKDGTRVLLYRPNWAEHTVVAWYHALGSEWAAVNGFDVAGEPTHWMPLPPAPPATEGDSK